MAHLPPSFFLHTPSPPCHELLLDSDKLRWPNQGTIHWQREGEANMVGCPNLKPPIIGPMVADRYPKGDLPFSFPSPSTLLPPRGTSMHTRGPGRWSCYYDLSGSGRTRTQREPVYMEEGPGLDPCCLHCYDICHSSHPTIERPIDPCVALEEDLPASGLGPLSRPFFRIGPHGDKCSASVGSCWPWPWPRP